MVTNAWPLVQQVSRDGRATGLFSFVFLACFLWLLFPSISYTIRHRRIIYIYTEIDGPRYFGSEIGANKFLASWRGEGERRTYIYNHRIEFLQVLQTQVCLKRLGFSTACFKVCRKGLLMQRWRLNLRLKNGFPYLLACLCTPGPLLAIPLGRQCCR